MFFGILGPLEIRTEAGPVRLAGQRRQRILAALLINDGRALSLDYLLDAVWGADPPATAKRQLQNSVSDLRRQLAAAEPDPLIVADGPGYRIHLAPDRFDRHAFEAATAAATRLVAADRPDRAAAELRRGLGLWRGPSLAGLTGEIIESSAARLDEQRLAATEQCLDLELRLGRHAQLVPELMDLVAANPGRERLIGQLMLALYRSGRKADALDVYRRMRARLADDLGIDPGPDLQEVHTAVLQDSTGAVLRPWSGPPSVAAAAERPPAARPEPDGPPAGSPPPSQLPADVAAFTGRGDALAQLDALLPAATGAPATAMAVGLITGTAGVGKTALAVHWAHRARAHFPDGQLYLNLRGHAAEQPLDPAEALVRFLLALGCPAPRIPADPEHAAEIYRSLLADRRVLVVLDNAYTPDQVRPLLPGSPGCLVLITSRSRLGGLVARDGAAPVVLDGLGDDEAGALLERLLGSRRVAAEPEATRQLAGLCGRIPLALRIAAANLSCRPWDGIGNQVERLRDGDRLAALAVTGDEHAAVRNTFDLSYDRLGADSRRMFRLLGLVPGTDVTAVAAAALGGTTVAQAAAQLEILAGAHLLHEQTPGRYLCHDLLRLYAAERAVADESGPDRRAAVARLGGWYLRAVAEAARTVYPQRLRLPDLPDGALGHPGAPEPAELPRFGSAAAALSWLDAERVNLVGVVTHAAEHGPRPVAWGLADALRGYFWLNMSTPDWLTVGRAGVAAAAADDHPMAVAAAHFNLADALSRQSHYTEALAHYRTVLAAGRRAGWPEVQAVAGGSLGVAYRNAGQPVEAERCLTTALEVARRIGDRYIEGVLLGRLGDVYRELGLLDHSVRALESAERILAECGNRHGRAVMWVCLGHTYHAKGMLDAAAARLTDAVAVMRELGDRSGESEVLPRLAAVERDRGRTELAARLATGALELGRTINDRRAVAGAHNVLAAVHQRAGRTAEAIAEYVTVIRLTWDSHDRYPQVEALLGLAEVHRGLARPRETVAGAMTALALARKSGYRLLEERAGRILVDYVRLPDGRALATAAGR
ncbi:AfsR/SARP family transcriptional regulator [Jidongwangia harbinensis]|uniref:AfsR/SARP family transcriptional regulator n=1 Tax=Jidongwangia harbinensis TaxID=2878561 RepID=UPI001CDA3046|nr:BTAD domain-containing putative transcriptional regulator [Jidongwangia harbinensis]MCA2215060.1 tetratricopeptide repeat protein [Jidongwangia harbinensis]